MESKQSMAHAAGKYTSACRGGSFSFKIAAVELNAYYCFNTPKLLVALM